MMVVVKENEGAFLMIVLFSECGPGHESPAPWSKSNDGRESCRRIAVRQLQAAQQCDMQQKRVNKPVQVRIY